MSDVVTLTLRARPEQPLDVEGLTPDACAALSEQEIASLVVWTGGQRAALGDFFSVRGGRAAQVRIVGDLVDVHGLGAGTGAGELTIDGPAGHRIGAGMTGGVVEVHGRVGDDAGLAMAGGTLRVQGDVGHRLGAASPGASRGMTGGEIIVAGRAGDDAAARARRGLVVVGGSTGAFAGRAMVAGTLLVFGRVGPSPGEGNKRGSLVCLGGVSVPATYRLACTYEPPFVRVLMTYLARRHGLAIDPQARDGLYRRYCGDAAGPAKGEILERVE
jgi:formylmethanofuran dehydrogenase subunit C